MKSSPSALTSTSCHLDDCQYGPLTPCFTRDVVPLRAELLREALRLTHRGADAEDLVQDTVLRAYRSFGTFRPGTNVRAWMYRILKNTWISNYRASQRRLTEVPMEELTEEPVDGVGQQSGIAPPELTVIAAQPDTEVQSAMAALSDEFRMVVYLADVQGYSYAAIADMMNTPVGTVMSRLHRARRQLRVDLGGTVRRRRLVMAA
jgi:RNA polymerase sigma-70 factor (ECF subfamily)